MVGNTIWNVSFCSNIYLGFSQSRVESLVISRIVTWKQNVINRGARRSRSSAISLSSCQWCRPLFEVFQPQNPPACLFIFSVLQYINRDLSFVRVAAFTSTEKEKSKKSKILSYANNFLFLNWVLMLFITQLINKINLFYCLYFPVFLFSTNTLVF